MHARSFTSILLLASLATTARGASTPPDVKCVMAKAKGAGAKAVAKIACHTKAIKKGVPVDPVCLAKAEQRFVDLFAKAELPGACPTTGDAASVEALVDDFVASVLAEVGASSTTTTTTTSTTTTTLAGCASSYAGCTSFTDRTADLADRTISFVPITYVPACMRVRVNQTVTFSGAFISYPLRRASCSPPGIPDVGSGTQQAITLTTLGVHGYYSYTYGTDAGLGMAGAIEVVP